MSATLSTELAALQAAMTAMTTAVTDAVNEIKMLASQIGSAATPDQLAQLATWSQQLTTQAQSIEDAVTAATPPATPPATP